MQPDITLTDLEWRAVSVALDDAARGCKAADDRPAGRLYRMMQAVFASKPVRPLADPRLEAMRGFVCEAWRSRRMPEGRVPDLLRQGFNRDQIAAFALLAA